MDSLDFTSSLARHMAGDMLWAYVLLALTTAPPLVPNSALLVTGGVLAAHGQLDIGLVLLVVGGSALAGDLVIHRGGRALSGPVVGRLYRRPRQRRLLVWAAGQIQRYGIPFVVACRFLPSGRLVGGLAAGVVGYPARRYAIGAGIAEAVWATYSVGIGYLGGRSTGNALYAVGLGLAVSAAVAGVGSLVQFAVGRRGRRAEPLPAQLPEQWWQPPAPDAAAPVPDASGGRGLRAVRARLPASYLAPYLAPRGRAGADAVPEARAPDPDGAAVPVGPAGRPGRSRVGRLRRRPRGGARSQPPCGGAP